VVTVAVSQDTDFFHSTCPHPRRETALTERDDPHPVTRIPFSTLLDRLFVEQMGPDGKPWSLSAVARELTARGLPTTQSYVSQLRSGDRNNPTLAYLTALAEVFGVPTSYFVGDGALEPALQADFDLAIALRAAGVKGIAMRATKLTPESLQMIQQILDSVRQREGLPPVE
jgi:transcriptional regulator with XRE-family HTH domain